MISAMGLLIMTDPVMKDFMEEQAKRRQKEQLRRGKWWKWIKSTILMPIFSGIEAANKSHWRRDLNDSISETNDDMESKMKSLYDENAKYTSDALALDRESARLIKPLMEEYVAKGYSPREVAHLINDSISLEGTEMVLTADMERFKKRGGTHETV